MDEDKPTTVPRDARTIEAILKSMGVEDYDPRVVQQLLEFLYRYVTTILTDSRQFADHADKQQIDVDDIKLAIRARCNHSFTQPPPRDVTMRLAAERNSIPLPPIDPTSGVALPPKDYQLTAQNYNVVIDPSTHASPKRPRMSTSPRKSPHTKSPSKSPRGSASPRKLNVASPTNSSSQQRSAAATPTRTQSSQPVDPDVMIIDPPPVASTVSKAPTASVPRPATAAVASVHPGGPAIPSAPLPSSVPGPGANPTQSSPPRPPKVTPVVVDLDAPPSTQPQNCPPRNMM